MVPPFDDTLSRLLRGQWADRTHCDGRSLPRLDCTYFEDKLLWEAHLLLAPYHSPLARILLS
jgi:hypothetical protein